MNDALRFGMMNQHMKVSNKFNQRDEFMMNMIQSTKVMPRGLSAVHSVCVCVCVCVCLVIVSTSHLSVGNIDKFDVQ